ncbi:hypothetical protein H0H81_002001 [Sphagnurus paluster]|uniref:Uncharacterized protein n=1 Tax=Sphagnurus paluster TaxID=117069 RepID=A0A9P7KKH6_9AGAR|nr:hypothetical protein H0H81_002001 [Sphagnurus paluster]
MTRLPSTVPANSSDYRGPILLNPGGPGGSGVDFVLGIGEWISSVVGPQFDIIGFDPRGVARSTPRVSFRGNAVERTFWQQNAMSASPDTLARAWARGKINGQLAGERHADILPYINTAQTAADMLSIVRAHGKEKLLYWGFSYGSLLGSTYAAMFPDKIERLVIDGVLDMEDYYKTLWATNLLDTDKTMNTFYATCHSAGPTQCAFYAPTPAQIAANLSSLYTTIRARPVPVRTALSYGLVDYTRLRLTLLTALCSPWADWPTLAVALADLARGNGTALYTMLEPPSVDSECTCPSAPDEEFAVVDEAGIAVSCNDGDVVPEDFGELEEYFKNTLSTSEWAELWDVRTLCVGWPSVPKLFKGPFGANTTSFPLLIVGNTADPLTPLWAAKKTAQDFSGAVVLTQDSPGHCSIAAPSVCTQKYIREYFANGTLPPNGTVCSVPGSPFDEPETLKSKSSTGVDAEDPLHDAVKNLSTLRRSPSLRLL